LALEKEKKEREAAMSEAREVSRKAMEEAALLSERAMMVEEAASRAQEEVVFFKGAAADLDKEKDLLKADLASARESFQKMKMEFVTGEIACHAAEEAKKKALEDLEAERARSRSLSADVDRVKRALLEKDGAIAQVLGILNANRKIRKRTDTDVAFTREYSRVSIFQRERECTN